MRPIGQEFASCLQEVCRKHDLLLMADEVQLGNGRSGSLYGYMNYGLQPDVVSTAKGIGGGLPLGVPMFGERVADVFHPGDHGTTFGGNPVCCAGAVNILSRIDDRLLEGVRERSDYLRRTLQARPRICGARTARRRARHDRQAEDPSSARAEYPHGAVENCRPGTGALRG